MIYLGKFIKIVQFKDEHTTSNCNCKLKTSIAPLKSQAKGTASWALGNNAAHLFIHSGDLYSASSRHYYSEALIINAYL